MRENRKKSAAVYFAKLFVLYAIFISLFNSYIQPGDDMIDFFKILAAVTCAVTLVFFYDKYRDDNPK